MTNIKSLMDEAIALRTGIDPCSHELALWYLNTNEWVAAIGGNPYGMLGEVSGVFQVCRETPEAALLELIEMIKDPLRRVEGTYSQNLFLATPYRTEQ